LRFGEASANPSVVEIDEAVGICAEKLLVGTEKDVTASGAGV
jgi:hypothetical protein